MTARDIIRKVRMMPGIDDNDEAKYSDWQMVDALNTVLNILHNELGTFSNDLLLRTEEVELEDGCAELPEDFLQMVQVYSGTDVYTPAPKGLPPERRMYMVTGRHIYADAERLTLDYKPCFVEVTMDTLDDDLCLPLYFKELLRRHVAMALKGTLDTDAATERMRDEVRRITAGRGMTELRMYNVWSEAL